MLLTDHSDAARGRIALDGGLRLGGGACRPGDGGGARAERELLVRAVHPDGRRLARAVAEAGVDDVLRELLRDGWHVEEVRR